MNIEAIKDEVDCFNLDYDKDKYIVKEKYFKIKGGDTLYYSDGRYGLKAYYYIDLQFYCIENKGLFELLLGKKIYNHKLESRDLVSYKLTYQDRTFRYAGSTEAEKVNYAISMMSSKYRDRDEYAENSGYMFTIGVPNDKQENWMDERNKEVNALRDMLLTLIIT